MSHPALPPPAAHDPTAPTRASVAQAAPGRQPRLLVLLLAAQWRHHPGQTLLAVLAIALGVALAFSVHLINASALAEFGQAVRAVNGQPDAVLRPASGVWLAESAYPRAALHPQVLWASPVLEIDTQTLTAAPPPGAPRAGLTRGQRATLRVLGIDALRAPALAPELLPRPREGADRLALLDPDQVFLNPAAQRLLAPGGGLPERIALQAGERLLSLAVGGSVAADGPPLVVMDLAGAQTHFGRIGWISRIDLRLAAGADAQALLAQLDRDAPPAARLRLASAQESAQRVSNLSRAYRVNLGVLSLVALFTGAFLVFSVQSLAVAKRVPQLALLGVLGMAARERRRLVQLEALLQGLFGAALGLALGTALAALALRWLGGDLGSGLLGGGAPPLQWSAAAAALYGALGVLAAWVGGALPARQAAGLAPALALKGLGAGPERTGRRWLGPALLLLALLLAFLPPLGDLPLAAYLAVALLLLGGILCVPALVGALLALLPRPLRPVPLLALERARDQRHSATVAVAGVVASLALAVALTVMVASFRDSVTHWLDQVLPADLYARTAAGTQQADAAWLGPDFLRRAAALPGVERLQPQRLQALPLDPAQPPLTLMARELDPADPQLPLVGELLDDAEWPRDAAGARLSAVYASEAAVALHRLRPGQTLELPLPDGRRLSVWLRGVWRDYARQQGTLLLGRADWLAATGDARVNDLAIWLAPGAQAAAVGRSLRALLPDPALLELATPGEIRAVSLQIFDRSFAVTYWLQAVAVAIGLFGISASFSGQVLARRREFGALQHLGMQRGELLALVAAEGAIWTAVGALLGLALGLAVALVLVHVVNPQSFHWTMELSLPAGRLALLALAVLAAGSGTAWLSGRAAASRQMALAVKEDW
ncbi:MAG: ABC transporter permease [Burkholderiaceae bacterium]|nr:ABC transporter permease [Burkholderiaceae bacterium]